MNSVKCDSKWYRRHPLTLHVILVAIFGVIALGGPYLIRQADYLSGLANAPGAAALPSLLFFPLLVLLALVFALYGFLKVFMRPRTFRHTALKLALAFAPVLILLGVPRVATPLAPAFLKGFEQWVLKEVDIDAIQQWLATEGAKHAGQSYHLQFPEELPAYLVVFKPMSIWFSQATPEESRTIEFRWSTPQGKNHGLIVGPPAMETPETDRIRLPDDGNEFQRPVRPGAYVFHRG